MASRRYLHRWTVDLNGPIDPDRLEEDVLSTLVLRDEVHVGMSDTGDALLAADERRIELGAVSVLIEHHDVETDDIDLSGGLPGNRSRAFSERAREADGEVADGGAGVAGPALGADAWILVWIGNGRTDVAGIPIAIEVQVGLSRIRHGRAVVADISERIAVRVRLIRVGCGDAVVADVPDSVAV